LLCCMLNHPYYVIIIFALPNPTAVEDHMNVMPQGYFVDDHLFKYARKLSGK